MEQQAASSGAQPGVVGFLIFIAAVVGLCFAPIWLAGIARLIDWLIDRAKTFPLVCPVCEYSSRFLRYKARRNGAQRQAKQLLADARYRCKGCDADLTPFYVMHAEYRRGADGAARLDSAREIATTIHAPEDQT